MDTVEICYWNPSAGWLPAWLGLRADRLELSTQPHAVQSTVVGFAQLTALDHQGQVPDGRHMVRVAYPSGSPADHTVVLLVSSETWGGLAAGFQQHRHPGSTWGHAQTPQPTFVEPPVATTQGGSSGALVCVLVGAALLVIGALLPWATISGPFFNFSANGVEGDGVFTLVAGLVVAAIITLGKARRGAAVASLIIGGLAGMLTVFTMANVSNAIDEAEATEFAGVASVGVGLWLTGVAAVVVLVGSIAAISSASR